MNARAQSNILPTQDFESVYVPSLNERPDFQIMGQKTHSMVNAKACNVSRNNKINYSVTFISALDYACWLDVLKIPKNIVSCNRLATEFEQ